MLASSAVNKYMPAIFAAAASEWGVSTSPKYRQRGGKK